MSGLRPSLRAVITAVLAAVSTIPVAVIGLYSLQDLTRHLTSGVAGQSLFLARSLANEADEFLLLPRAVLGQVSEALDRKNVVSDVNAYLDLAVQESGIFESLYLVDERGWTTHVGLPADRVSLREDYLGIDLSAQPEIGRGCEAGGACWSDAFTSLVTGRPSVTLSVPADSGKTLVGSFSVEGLRRITSRVPPAEGYIVAIVDRKGSILFHSDAEIADQRVNVRNIPLVRAALAGREGTETYSFMGRKKLGSAALVGSTGWLVVVSQEILNAHAPIRRLWTILGAGVAASLFLALAAALYFSRKIILPLARFVEETRRIADGDYGLALPPQPHAEIEELASGFRKMAEGIKAREKSLEEGEARLRAILDNSPAAIYIRDTGSRYTLANRQTAAIAGIPMEEIPGRTPGEIFPRDFADEIVRTDRIVIESGQPLQHMQDFPATGDAGLRTYLTVKFPLFDSSGNLYAVGGISTDMTDRIRVEEEARRLQEDLLQAQKMETVGRLAGGVAHDFNNLLSSVLGYAELAAMKLPKDHPVVPDLAMIESAGQKAAALTRQLLAFSRKQILEMRPVSLSGIVEEIGKMLTRTIGENISLDIKTSPGLKNIMADRGQIEQVIMNLAVNARDAMPEGGRLTIETKNEVLGETESFHHGRLVPGEYVRLSVTDTGGGMTPEVREKLFEPFFTTKGVGKGTGLGLATVYGIVKQHRGYLWVYSEPGQGTSFMIYLPATDRLEEKRADSQVKKPLPRGSETILVVDDEAAVRNVVRDTLVPLGYEVIEAGSGTEALERAGGFTGRIDLLLSDIVMPGMSGVELARVFRERYPATRTILMSGYSDIHLIEREIMEKDTPYLQKPLTPSSLTRKLREVLG